MALDEPTNNAHPEIISRPDSKVEVRVVATDEESIIARHGSVVMQVGSIA